MNDHWRKQNRKQDAPHAKNRIDKTKEDDFSNKLKSISLKAKYTILKNSIIQI